MKNKGFRIFLGLFLSIISLIICITLNMGSEEKENNANKVSIIGYVEPKNTLIIKDEISIEINTKLPTINEYFENYDLNDDVDIKYYLSNKEVDSNYVLKNVNTYKVVIVVKNLNYTTKLKVVDTIKPVLKLKNITINEGEKYNLKSFINSCNDNSGKECILSYTNEKSGKYVSPASYTIGITAKDESGNTTTLETKLTIKKKIVSNINSNKISNKVSNKTSNKSSGDTKKTTIQVQSKYKTTNELKPQAINQVNNNKKIANEIIKYTNTYRKEVGAKELKYDQNLSIAATIRAIEIAIYDKFDHVRPNGLSYSSVLKDLGITVRCSGENIAYGYLDAEEVSVAWKNSSGHYKNMINTKYNKIGIGYFEYNNTTYFVQTFTN